MYCKRWRNPCETSIWFSPGLPVLFIKYSKSNENQWHLDRGEKVIEFRKWNWNEPLSEGHLCSIKISVHSERWRKDNTEQNLKAFGINWQWWEKYILDKKPEGQTAAMIKPFRIRSPSKWYSYWKIERVQNKIAQLISKLANMTWWCETQTYLHLRVKTGWGDSSNLQCICAWRWVRCSEALWQGWSQPLFQQETSVCFLHQQAQFLFIFLNESSLKNIFKISQVDFPCII